jgi:hypothetical protein
MHKAVERDGYPRPSLLKLNDENRVWRKNIAGNGGGAMFLLDRDSIILSTSTNTEEQEPLIRKALNLELYFPMVLAAGSFVTCVFLCEKVVSCAFLCDKAF